MSVVSYYWLQNYNMCFNCHHLECLIFYQMRKRDRKVKHLLNINAISWTDAKSFYLCL